MARKSPDFGSIINNATDILTTSRGILEKGNYGRDGVRRDITIVTHGWFGRTKAIEQKAKLHIDGTGPMLRFSRKIAKESFKGFTTTIHQPGISDMQVIFEDASSEVLTEILGIKKNPDGIHLSYQSEGYRPVDQVFQGESQRRVKGLAEKTSISLGLLRASLSVVDKPIAERVIHLRARQAKRLGII